MRDQRLIRLAVIAATLLCAGTLLSETYKPVVLPLVLNQVSRGDVLIGLGDEDILMRVKDLQQVGMSGEAWRRVLIAGRLRTAAPTLQGDEAVLISSLAPWLKATFDQANLRLAMTADPRLFAPTVTAIQQNRPKDLIYSHDNTTFLNYAVTSGFGSGENRLSAFAETGTSIGGNLLYNSASRTSDGRIQRTLSNFTIDQPSRLQRWIVGDSTAGFDSLSGAPFVGGVTFRRSFNLDPYFIRYPAMNLQGSALTPSRVSVYVNGMLVSQREVPPGPFELQNLPLTGGAGVTQVVVRDAFGNERVESGSYYYSTEVLARGLSDFSYTAGWIRQDIASKSFSYGDPVAFAAHRYGLTDSLTVGGRVEASRNLWSGGPTANIRARFGEFDLSLAASSAAGRTGNAQMLNYRYLARRFNFGLVTRRLSAEYANVSLRPQSDRATLDTTLFGSVVLRRSSILGQISETRFRDSDKVRRAGVQTNILLTPRLSAFVSAGLADVAGRRDGEYAFGFSVYAGHNTTANVNVERRGDRSAVTAEVQKSLPVGTGYGYHLQARSAESTQSGSGSMQYQTSFGRYELGFDPFDLGSQSLTASGGIVYQQHHVVFTRAVQDAFGLVRVAGVPNVRVYLSNQLVGRTDERGDLLVPNLLSYYGNEVRINDDDIPLNYDVGQVRRTVAPPFRGGALLDFPIRRVQTVTGRAAIRTAAGDVPPSYGELTVMAGSAELVSPLGKLGEFYLENISAGTYQAVIEYADGTCRFDLKIPATGEMVVRLGTVVCPERQEGKP